MSLYDASYAPRTTVLGKAELESNDARSNFLNGSHPSNIEGCQQYGNIDNQSDVESHGYLESTNSLAYGNETRFGHPGRNCFFIMCRLFDATKRLFYHQRQCVQTEEGPSLIRMLCFMGGILLFTSSSISMLNLKALFRSPIAYLLQSYQGLFGTVIMIVESKNWDCFDQLKPWVEEWFRFLSVPGGRGAFYLFVGLFGISLWIRNFITVCIGLYMIIMGLICIAVHAGLPAGSFYNNHGQSQADEYGNDYLDPSYDYHEGDMTTCHSVAPRHSISEFNELNAPMSASQVHYRQRRSIPSKNVNIQEKTGDTKKGMGNPPTLPQARRTTSTASSSSSVNKF